MAQKPHEPTEAKRKTVLMHLASGATEATIADALGIAEKTLRKYYRRELDVGFAEMNAQVTGRLYNRCMEGSDTALIWWDKTRNRMSAPPVTVEPKDLDGGLIINIVN